MFVNLSDLLYWAVLVNNLVLVMDIFLVLNAVF